MATVSYRCPIDPQGCPEAAEWGYCDTHSYPLQLVIPTPGPSKPPAPAPAAPMPPTVVQPQPVTVAELALNVLGTTLIVPTAGELVLGREEPPLADVPGMAGLTMVGRRHARVYPQAGRSWVVDLQSKNGTYLDGVRVSGTEPMALRPGQVLRLGKAGGPTLTVCSVADDLDEFGLPR